MSRPPVHPGEILAEELAEIGEHEDLWGVGRRTG
jgi:plasmid maintenance system antidote protein VapI